MTAGSKLSKALMIVVTAIIVIGLVLSTIALPAVD